DSRLDLTASSRHCERSEPRRTPGLDCFGALRAPRNDKCFPDVVNFRTRTLARALEVLGQAGHQLDEVAGAIARVELPAQDLVPAVAHRARRAGEREEVGAVG